MLYVSRASTGSARRRMPEAVAHSLEHDHSSVREIRADLMTMADGHEGMRSVLVQGRLSYNFVPLHPWRPLILEILNVTDVAPWDALLERRFFVDCCTRRLASAPENAPALQENCGIPEVEAIPPLADAAKTLLQGLAPGAFSMMMWILPGLAEACGRTV